MIVPSWRPVGPLHDGITVSRDPLTGRWGWQLAAHDGRVLDGGQEFSTERAARAAAERRLVPASRNIGVPAG